MGTKVTLALLGAGGPAGINFLRSWLSDPRLVAETRAIYAFDASPAHEPFLGDIRSMACSRGVELGFEVMEGIDLERLHDLDAEIGGGLFLHAQPDPLVARLATLRSVPSWPPDLLLARARLPDVKLVEFCQDKLATSRAWCEADMAGRVVLVESPSDVRFAEETFGGYPFWLRARSGAGARGSACVRSRREAEAWARFWYERAFDQNNRRASDMTAHEYLSGRDYAVSLVMLGGECVGAIERERLEYIYPQHSVSGRTGTPVVARLLRDDRLLDVALKAVKVACAAAGASALGPMSVDLRAESDEPDARIVPTEINCGRFFTTSHVGLGVGVNLVGLWGRGAALGEWPARDQLPLRLPEAFSRTLVTRHVDAPTVWTTPENQTDELRAFVERMRA